MTTTDRASACLALVELSLLIKIVTPNAFNGSPSAIIRYRVNVGAGAPLLGIKRFGSNIFRPALSIAFLWPAHRTSLGTGPHLTLTPTDPYWRKLFATLNTRIGHFPNQKEKLLRCSTLSFQFLAFFSIPWSVFFIQIDIEEPWKKLSPPPQHLEELTQYQSSVEFVFTENLLLANGDTEDFFLICFSSLSL